VELNQHVKKETAGKVVNVKLLRSASYFSLLTSSYKKSQKEIIIIIIIINKIKTIVVCKKFQGKISLL